MDLRLKLEDSKRPVAYKDLLEGDTVGVVAMAKPIESMLDLAVPGLVLLPIDFLDVTKMIKSEVHADRESGILRTSFQCLRSKVEDGADLDLTSFAILTFHILEKLVHLLGYLKIGPELVLRSLVAYGKLIVAPRISLILIKTHEFIELFKEILAVTQLLPFQTQYHRSLVQILEFLR